MSEDDSQTDILTFQFSMNCTESVNDKPASSSIPANCPIWNQQISVYWEKEVGISVGQLCVLSFEILSETTLEADIFSCCGAVLTLENNIWKVIVSTACSDLCSSLCEDLCGGTILAVTCSNVWEDCFSLS